ILPFSIFSLVFFPLIRCFPAYSYPFFFFFFFQNLLGPLKIFIIKYFPQVQPSPFYLNSQIYSVPLGMKIKHYMYEAFRGVLYTEGQLQKKPLKKGKTGYTTDARSKQLLFFSTCSLSRLPAPLCPSEIPLYILPL